jgi:hypothetical protein
MRTLVKYTSYCFIEIFHVTWLIYGNYLYYAKENTCNDESGFLSLLMLAFLLIGYMHFLLYGAVCLIFAGFILTRRRRESQI